VGSVPEPPARLLDEATGAAARGAPSI